MYNLKLTKKDLTAIIQCLKKTNIINIIDLEDCLDLKQIVPGVISILLIECFGEYNSELIWNYAMNSSNNKFNSIEDLYSYLKDPYSQIVCKDSALTIAQLRQVFPEEKMFKTFEKIINNIC